MNRAEEIIKLLEYDFNRNFAIEPEFRLGKIREILFDEIKRTNPRVIVKTGIGNDKLLLDIINNFDSYIVVVEPSFNNIEAFIEKYKGDQILERLKIINGDFSALPIDYYAANLIINIDLLDILDSAKVIDELREALDFESKLFIATIVLNEDDLDGIFDEFMRLISPVHNDYYLAEDLNTILDLNGFININMNVELYQWDYMEMRDYFVSIFQKQKDNPEKYLKEHIENFKKLYKIKKSKMLIPYYIGTFFRKKPEIPDSKI